MPRKYLLPLLTDMTIGACSLEEDQNLGRIHQSGTGRIRSETGRDFGGVGSDILEATGRQKRRAKCDLDRGRLAVGQDLRCGGDIQDSNWTYGYGRLDLCRIGIWVMHLLFDGLQAEMRPTSYDE